MSPLEWSKLFAEASPTLGLTFGMMVVILFGFWKFLDGQQEKAYHRNDERYKNLDRRIAKVERFDAEFKVMQTKLEHVQAGVEGLKQDIKDNAELQRKELNSGLGGLKQDIKDYVKAISGK